MINNNRPENTHEYIWEFFALHAKQRTILFNMYIVFISLFAYAITNLLLIHIENNCGVKPYEYYLVGMLGVFFAVVTFVFYKLDNRNKVLIDYAKVYFEEYEDGLRKNKLSTSQIFLRDKNNKMIFRHSVCFRIIFYVGYIISFVLIIYSLCRIFCPPEQCKINNNTNTPCQTCIYYTPSNYSSTGKVQ